MLSTERECSLVVAYANGYRGEDEPPSLRAFDVRILEDWSARWAKDPRFADDLEEMVFAVARFSYDAAILMPLVLDVAYGRTAPVLFFGAGTGRVYSPYDGGADLFFEAPGVRDAKRTELADWVSRRSDGL
jgi:hypothetical protein